MNWTPYLHLLWKEYRAIRGFWIALVALALGLQWLGLTYSTDAAWRLLFLYNVALATPAFFALGCAATAWAIEREDETFQWLRAAPVSERQVFVSKLALAAAATLAMYALLWLLAWWTAGRLPAAGTLRGMLGLWLIAGAEALAWGTLFSLLMTRPLASTCLALFVTSAVVHVLAWSLRSSTVYEFDFADYLAAGPWRLAILVVVLGFDVYLGLRWMHGSDTESQRRPLRIRLRRKANESVAANERTTATQLRIARSRSSTLGHLFWQQWRQSRWMMCGLAAAFVALATLAVISAWQDVPPVAFVAALIIAVLAGTFAFQPDQERRNYRFFQEHNVPPRYVWFTRQVPWIALLTLSTVVVLLLSLYPLWYQFLRDVDRFASSWQRGHVGPFDRRDLNTSFALLLLGPAWIATAYASGQFCSMLIRSGLLAGVAAALLGGVLCFWILLVLPMMHLSWFATVAPIPLVLLWATWLRAPDWVSENNTWPARSRIIAATVIPAVAMVTSVAAYRVWQVPDVAWSPGSAMEMGAHARRSPDDRLVSPGQRRLRGLRFLGRSGRQRVDPWRKFRCDGRRPTGQASLAHSHRTRPPVAGRKRRDAGAAHRGQPSPDVVAVRPLFQSKLQFDLASRRVSAVVDLSCSRSRKPGKTRRSARRLLRHAPCQRAGNAGVAGLVVRLQPPR